MNSLLRAASKFAAASSLIAADRRCKPQPCLDVAFDSTNHDLTKTAKLASQLGKIPFLKDVEPLPPTKDIANKLV
jgi:hypothetical protein